MIKRGQHTVERVKKRARNWTSFSDNANFLQPFYAMGEGLERLTVETAQAQMQLASEHNTPPFAPRLWYRYQFNEIDNTELVDLNRRFVGDTQQLTEVTNLLDFKMGPPTSYGLDDDYNSGDSTVAYLSGKTVLHAEYVHDLQTQWDTEPQDAIVFMIAATATDLREFYILYNDGTARSIPIATRFQSWETNGEDERVEAEDFSYTPTYPVYEDGSMKLLDLVRSNNTAKFYQDVPIIPSAFITTGNALTGDITFLSEVFVTGDADDQGGNYQNSVTFTIGAINYLATTDYNGAVVIYRYNASGDLTYITENTANIINGMDVAWDGTYLYVTDMTAPVYNAVRAFTFDGTTLTYKATTQPVDSSTGYGIEIVAAGIIAVAEGQGGLRTYSFNGTAFSFVDNDDKGSTYIGIAKDDTYFYCSARGGDLLVAYSIDNSGNITHEDTYAFAESGDTLNGVSYGVAAHNGRVYVAADTDGIYVFTFDGSTLTYVNKHDDGGNCRGLWVNGDYVFAGLAGGGVYAYTEAGGVFTTLDSVAESSYGLWYDATNALLFTNRGGAGVNSYFFGEQTPATITLYDVSAAPDGFTAAFYLSPGAGRSESGFMWVDTDGILHVKFDTTELTTPLYPTDSMYRVVITYDTETLALYVDNELRDSETEVTFSSDLTIIPFNQWGGATGVIGPMEYWNTPWNTTEVEFDFENPGISAIYTPGSLLTEDHRLHHYPMIEGAGNVIRGTGGTNIDLTQYSNESWTTNTDIPSILHYAFARRAYNRGVSTDTKISGLATNTLTIESAFGAITGTNAANPILEIWDGTTELLNFSFDQAGTEASLKINEVEVETQLVDWDDESDHYFRIIIDDDAVSLEIDGVASDNSPITLGGGAPFSDETADVYWGTDHSGADPIEGILYFLAISNTHVATEAMSSNYRPRNTGLFAYQWFNDVYQDKLWNYSAPDITMSTSYAGASFQYALATEDSTGKIRAMDSFPAKWYHAPYFADSVLYPVLPGKIQALEYDYLDAEDPIGFGVSAWYYTNRQPVNTTLENTIFTYDHPNSESVSIAKSSKVGSKIEVTDPRVENGTVCNVTIKAVKAADQAWADSSSPFTYEITDGDFYEVTSDMIHVIDGNGSVMTDAVIYTKDNGIYIESLTPNAAYTVRIRYTITDTLTKTFSRNNNETAYTSLSASDMSGIADQVGIQVTSITLQNTSTYGAPSYNQLPVQIGDNYGPVYGQLFGGNDNFVRVCHSLSGDDDFVFMNIPDTGLSMKHFFYHWAILTDSSTIRCMAPFSGAELWHYNINAISGYTATFFTFDAENNMYVFYTDATDWIIKKYIPRYDYGFTFIEPNAENSSLRDVTVFTRYKYTDMTLETELETAPTKAGYQLYQNGIK